MYLELERVWISICCLIYDLGRREQWYFYVVMENIITFSYRKSIMASLKNISLDFFFGNYFLCFGIKLCFRFLVKKPLTSGVAYLIFSFFLNIFFFYETTADSC